MFKLSKLELENFFSFKSANIDFTSPGLKLILGYDDESGDSNGSGKSTILNAIAFALFGRTLKGVQGQDVVRWGEKNCKVRLILTEQAHIYEIERTLDKISFSIDSILSRGSKNDIQSIINTTFKTDFFTFIRSTAFSQSQVEFLAASGDADKKKLFKDVLGLSRLDRVYARIKDLYDFTFRNCESLEYALKPVEDQIKVLIERASVLEEQKTVWENSISRRIEILLQQKEVKPDKPEPIKQKISAVEECLSTYKSLGEERNQLEQELFTYALDEESNNKEISRLWNLIEKAEHLGERSTRCEVCGGMINRKMLSYHKKELEDKIAGLTQMNTERSSQKNEIKAKLLRITVSEAEETKIKDKLGEYKRDLAVNTLQWKNYEEFCKSIEGQIKEVENDGNPYVFQIDSIENENRLLKFKMQEITEKFEKERKNLDIYAFLKFVLSKEGAISHIVEREFERLVNLSNKFLSKISGGSLHISIKPQRELKTGGLKEEITVDIYLKDKKATYWGISDGQRARINIALLLSLNKLCQEHGVNNFDFILLDEVLDLSLDSGGEQDVTTLLNDYLYECGTILLVSHKSQFKESFNELIKVYRDEDGVSSLMQEV